MSQFKITKYGFQGNVTGSLQGTASYANVAATASYTVDLDQKYDKTGGTITGDVYIEGSLGQGGTGQGQAVTASGAYSHAQGAGSEARAIGAHAEGYITVAHGQYSHAEGNQAVASGSYSHAEGFKTVAKESYQTVVGKLNADNSDALFIIGAGLESDPSQSGEQELRRNAFAVKADGNIDMLQGAVLNGTASYALKAAEAENVAEVSASIVATIDDNERVTAASLNDLNGKVGGDTVYVAISTNISLPGVSGYAVPVSNSYQKHFILFNSSTATCTVTLPTGSATHSLDASIDIDAKSYGEVNIMKANNELWVRAI